jgi:hypothetical protein
MKLFAVVVAVALASPAGLPLAPSTAHAQLYGDKKNITKGDLNDQDFWWSKYDDMMLDLALKQHQPEGRIGIALASQSRRLDDLLKKYPNHEEIKRMRSHTDEVLKKIDPNANRSESFTPECPWEEANFAQIWVNMHWAKASWDEKDYANVQRLMQNVNQNLDIMLEPDRMKSYPAELSRFVRDAKPEAERLAKAANDKLTVKSGPDVKADTSVTSGDLNNQDYWWARYDDMMLDLAVKEHQPEGHIDVQLATAIRRLDDLLKKYPNHEGLKAMKQHAEDVHAKIDPKADRNAAFTPEVPWEEANFAQLWVNMHHAQYAHTQKDDKTASGLLGNIRQNQEVLLKPDRMQHYPADLRKWVTDSKADYDKLAKELKGKH